MSGREFDPGEMEAALAAFDRRTFLKLMGAAGALGGVACTRSQPAEKIVPYVRSPEHGVPGVPQFYATALPTAGFASGFGRGVVVEQHEGRPTKIEGNPEHPSSLGGTDIFMQAGILQLYDPDRSKMCRRGGEVCTWGNFVAEVRRYFGGRGDGLRDLRVRLLSPAITSPSLAAQMTRLRNLFPQFRRHVHEVPGVSRAREGQRLALGRAVTPVYDLGAARRMVSLDAHFLADEPGAVRYAREFARGRRGAVHGLGANQTHVDAGWRQGAISAEVMSRLYVAESTVTFTGASADHRVGVRPSMMPWVAVALARVIAGGDVAGVDLPPEVRRWVVAAGADLRGHRGAALVLAGETVPAEVHALVHGMNGALGAAGRTVRYVEPVDVPAAGESSLAALVRDLEAGDVDLLLMLDVNPVYTGAGGLRFGEVLREFSARKGRKILHVGGTFDETAAMSDWHVPLSHPLEAWGDLRGHEGSVAIVQPLIEPLYQTRSALEVLAAVAAVAGEAQGESAGDIYIAGYERLRTQWFSQWHPPTATAEDVGAAEMRWRRALRDGVVADSAAAELALDVPDLTGLLEAAGKLPRGESGIEIAIRADPTVGDGAWANLAWLQELPKPFSRVTWETVALTSAGTARTLGVEDAAHEARGTVSGVRVSANGAVVEVPVMVQAGVPEGVVVVHLGGGRTAAGRVQEGVGEDVYRLQRAENPWAVLGKVEKSDGRFEIATTQSQQTMEGRDVARSRPVAASLEKSKEAQQKVSLSLYAPYPYVGYKWGMVVDLSACIGCQACVVACQAENNIATVGKEQVLRGRAMHWLRIDTYRLGNGGGEGFAFQPMLCQHCENAPCEVVCPVEATSHSEEGVNEMTYNRCIGTRYCSNNCPYKVRRFNFLEYGHPAPHNTASADQDDVTLDMQKNPNVTVRSRGVMEKCTYCIQRINRARIAVKREWGKSAANPGRTPVPAMRAAEMGAEALPRIAIQTACQQACPAEAIFFGDLNDADAVVTRMKGSPLNYGVLAELNTQPRTTYLERVTNPNPALAEGGGA